VTAARRRSLAGGAGLGYVAGVAIENGEILEAPTLASPVADIRALYDDQAFGVVTTLAGAIALVFYVVFAVALFRLVRERGPRGERWSVVGLVGGIGGPALGAAGLVAASILVVGGTDGLSDGEVGDLFDFSLRARIVSGIFVAMFLLGIGMAARRAGALPAWLAWAACAIAVPMAAAPLAAFGDAKALEVGVGIAFGFQMLWIFLTSLWLLLADGVGAVTFVRRAAFLVLVLAAALIGVALLAVPAATGEFFSWKLEPAPLAAFAGGVYVGSAVAYAVALPRTERQVRGLVVGAVVLSVSVLVVTLTHLDPFDFDRLQAWAWVVLFAAFSLVTSGVLLLGPGDGGDEPDAGLTPGARVALALVAGLLGALALALWIDPTGLAGPSPFDLPPLGGRFAGCWVALLAVLAGWAALRNRVDEAQLSLVALIALPAGALAGALRTISDLEPAGGYVAGIALLLATGIVLLASLRETPAPPVRPGARVRRR
jgi:hypothetical protein